MEKELKVKARCSLTTGILIMTAANAIVMYNVVSP